MIKKVYSWRSFGFLIMSLLVSLSMIILDPVASTLTERVGDFIIVFIFIGTGISIVMGIITFINKTEKRLLSIIALLITILNIIVISFFLLFGANFT